jgi:uncharacterized protein (DUF302 family)
VLLHADTRKSLERLREDVPSACAAHRFGVLGTIDLEARMKEKGVVLGGPCLVFEVCNPQQAKRALDADPSTSTMLPCRISVYRTSDGALRLATLRPTRLIGLFGTDPALAAVAKEVEASLDAILADAAR